MPTLTEHCMLNNCNFVPGLIRDARTTLMFRNTAAWSKRCRTGIGNKFFHTSLHSTMKGSGIDSRLSRNGKSSMNNRMHNHNCQIDAKCFFTTCLLAGGHGECN